MKSKRVVIVGAGFAGLNVAKGLANQKGIDVVLIDRRNHHLFQPLLYQVAMAGLSPAEIAIPIRAVFAKAKNISVLLGLVERVDTLTKRIFSEAGEIEYDYLVLACGAEHSYFRHPEWEEFAPGLKTVEQATEIRRRVLYAFEKAEANSFEHEDFDPWLTFVVVGAGPTGVELAGALSELTRFTLARDFRHINPQRTRIVLVEAGSQVLSSFPDDLSARAASDLKSMGVEIRLNSPVESITSEGAKIGETFIAARTVIWAAGVSPSSLNKSIAVDLDKAGRALVADGLTLPNDESVFVIGDQISVKDAKGKALPGVAPVAMQQGRYVAKQILGDLKGKPRENFRYVDKGQMAAIGRRRAIVNSGGLHIGGFTAWLIWLFIHIFYLVGFSNRFSVLWHWGYGYLTYKRGARLITEHDWRLKASP